jgi:hypothetical protein
MRPQNVKTFASKLTLRLISLLTCYSLLTVHGPHLASCPLWELGNRLSQVIAIQPKTVSISPYTNAMRVSQLWACLLALYTIGVSATALTYKMQPNEKSCFFAWVDQKSAKIAFYFAVRLPFLTVPKRFHLVGKWLTHLYIQVQSGGAFDVDYEVVGPNERTIMKGEKERQGDFVFTANDVGEYRFCFNNEMSTFAEKIVDFEIAVRNSLFSA